MQISMSRSIIMIIAFPPLFNVDYMDRCMCLADAIHNFKWVKIIQIWQNGGHLFSNIAD